MKPQTKKPERRKRLPVFLVGILALAVILWLLPMPKIKAQTSYTYQSHPAVAQLAWPTYGEAAVGALNYGLLDTHGNQSPVPMASLAKTITAMAVLNKKPLSPGQQGGTITITQADVDSYNSYVAQDGSVVPVTAGEQLSEYQALQAMLLPSANNMADTLARWAFGSTDNFTTYANAYVKKMGMTNTTLAGASGFSDKSVSSAQDMTTLGLAFIKNEVLSGIVSQTSAEIPVAGTVHNVNWLLGNDGVIGIKTGNTDEAGGCYLVAAKHNIQGEDITLVATIMSAPDLTTAITDGKALIDSASSGFTNFTVAKQGQVIGLYVSPWGQAVNVVSKNQLSVLTWKSRQAISTLQINKNDTSVSTGQVVGTITATAWNKKSIGYLTAAGNINKPSWTWRLYGRYL